MYFGSNPAAGKDGGKALTDLVGVGHHLHVDVLTQGTGSYA